jgi:DNA-directed RNA polymerase specialized sigma24 family protein
VTGGVVREPGQVLCSTNDRQDPGGSGLLIEERVEQSVGQLAEPRQREVLLALYRDRLDYRSVRSEFGVNAKELNELQQAALAALIECPAPEILEMPNQGAPIFKP